MTTAHRPTFDPARGKELPKGPAYHQRLLPAHTKLKIRKPGQGGDVDRDVRDLHTELLNAEAAARARTNQGMLHASSELEMKITEAPANKRAIQDQVDCPVHEQTKRRKILEETRDIDADSDGTGEDSDSNCEDESDDDSDDEDETIELWKELEKIKRERAQQKEKDQEREQQELNEAKEFRIARGNPLLNPKSMADFSVKRRWDDDVIFRNQARGTDDRNLKKAFVNDLLRSDFHKKFMNKYVR